MSAEEFNQIVSTLITSCVSLIEKIQMGCDNYNFLSCVKKATEETQRFFNFVVAIETPNTFEKEELLNETRVVKNVVIKLIQQARNYHKIAPPNSPAATTQQIAQLKSEFATALQQVKTSARRFYQVEALRYIRHTAEYGDSENNSNLFEESIYNSLQGEQDIVHIAVECLQALSEMSQALQTRDKTPFANATKSAISLVNKLMGLQTDISKESLTGLQQNLVSLISHSKMYFVNPNDDNVKNTFFISLDSNSCPLPPKQLNHPFLSKDSPTFYQLLLSEYFVFKDNCSFGKK